MHHYEVISSPIKSMCLTVSLAMFERGDQKYESSLLSHFFLDYSSRRTGVCDLCIIAQGLLSEFVIEPSTHSEAKYCRAENPVWKTWDARQNSRLDNACHHLYMQIYVGHKLVLYVRYASKDTYERSPAFRGVTWIWDCLFYIWSIRSLMSSTSPAALTLICDSDCFFASSLLFGLFILCFGAML